MRKHHIVNFNCGSLFVDAVLWVVQKMGVRETSLQEGSETRDSLRPQIHCASTARRGYWSAHVHEHAERKELVSQR